MTSELQDMGGDELLALDNQLCFLLYSSSRMMTAVYRPLLDRLGITYPQYLVLLVLWEAHGSRTEVAVKDLGERLLLDSGTLTPLLKRMAQQGLITRTRAATDERKVIVRLTPEGLQLKAQAVEVPKALLCHSRISGAELRNLKQGLERLLDNLVER